MEMKVDDAAVIRIVRGDEVLAEMAVTEEIGSEMITACKLIAIVCRARVVFMIAKDEWITAEEIDDIIEKRTN
jgi:hypothetical protein